MPNSESDRHIREVVMLLLSVDGSLKSQMVSSNNSYVPFLVDYHTYTKLSLTLSVHSREGYSSHFVCLSVCVSLTDFTFETSINAK